MDTFEKLGILAGSARYDASCATSGSSRPRSSSGARFGSTIPSGICHSFADDGRCISLLKVLFSNECVNDCAYCVNRRSSGVPRAAFDVEEIVHLTESFYRRNFIEGLFLSSGVAKNPDHTMELMLRVVRKLRQEAGFNGYIHMKVIPGCSADLVRQAGLWADRLSANIELPSEESLSRLAPQKSGQGIFRAMAAIDTEIKESGQRGSQARLPAALPRFAPSGQSTQLVVGASPESDLRILGLAEALYRRYRLRRVYYSAFMPVSNDNRLPAVSAPPLRREHRLYQADWLLRLYGFMAGEILEGGSPFLDLGLDPKCAWALRHFDRFPVEVSTADYGTLLRVPGIGMKSAQRIVQARRSDALSFEALKRIGVTLKRARYFITCRGKSEEMKDRPTSSIRMALSQDERTSDALRGQLMLFDDAREVLAP